MAGARTASRRRGCSAKRLASRHAWERLAELGDTFGHRLSGSQALEDAIDWAVEQMKKDGLENVRKEPVKVPHWVRGRESLQIVSPRRPRPRHARARQQRRHAAADGVEARAADRPQLPGARRGRARGEGKDRPLQRSLHDLRRDGAVPVDGAIARRRARRGRRPRPRGRPSGAAHAAHRRAELRRWSRAKIPAAAVTTEDADRLQRMTRSRQHAPACASKMEAKFLPDADSFNVVGEIRGRERPDEVVVVGGHFDSWDVGTGSTDDGGGCVVTWEALRLMKKLNLRPRRTVRVVLWTNEENGLRGGNAYRDRHRDQLANHVLMLESDSGVFRPTGFGFTRQRNGAREGCATSRRCCAASRPIASAPRGGGADIGPSVQAGNIPSMSLDVEGNYFLLHHTPADTIDKIDPMDMARASAAIAVMTYVIAEMPERLR